MIRVAVYIAEPSQRLMLQAVFERAGFTLAEESPDVIVGDDFEAAVQWSAAAPTLVISGVGEIADAVQAMQRGVWGYILLPLQPGEAELMVRRAADAGRPAAPFNPRPLAEVELEHILAVVRHCNGNRAEAARILGIGRNTLWRKLGQLEKTDPSAATHSSSLSKGEDRGGGDPLGND